MTKESVLHDYKDIFEGQGTFETKSKIRIDEKATPVVHPPRRFPHAIRDRLHDELGRELHRLNPAQPAPTVSAK